MGYVRKSAAELAADAKRAEVEMQAAGNAVQSAGSALNGLGAEAGNASKAMGALQNANMALQRLMTGDIVGAFKLAGKAVKDFWGAITSSPALAALSAVGVAVAAVVAQLKLAKQAADEFNAGMQRGQDIANRLKNIRSPAPKALDQLSDDELAAMKAETEKTKNRIGKTVDNYREQADDLRTRQGNQGWRANTRDWIMGKFGFDTADSKADDAEDLLEKITAEEEAAAAKLADINAELERRKKARRKKATEDAAAATEKTADTLAEDKAAFQLERELDAIEHDQEQGHGEGKIAAAQYQVDKLQAKRDALVRPFQETGMKLGTAEEKELLEIDKQIFRLNQQIRDTKEQAAKTQKEAAEREAKTQADWQRGRKLGKMDAGERAEYIQKEIDALRQQKPTDENKAKMRGLIDERDAAKKEADTKAEQDAKKDADARKALEKRLWERDFEKADAKGQRRMLREQMKEAQQIADPIARQNRLLDIQDRLDQVDDADGGGKKKKGLSASAGERAARARRNSAQDYMRRRIMARSGVQFNGPAAQPAAKPKEKSDEAKGIDRTNGLLEAIQKALA